jgi:hypothetical protein
VQDQPPDRGSSAVEPRVVRANRSIAGRVVGRARCLRRPAGLPLEISIEREGPGGWTWRGVGLRPDVRAIGPHRNYRT